MYPGVAGRTPASTDSTETDRRPVHKLVWDKRVDYAMGWDLEFGAEGAVRTMSHSGSWEGFQTYIGHDIEREVTIVVLSNRRRFATEAFGEAVGAIFRN